MLLFHQCSRFEVQSRIQDQNFDYATLRGEALFIPFSGTLETRFRVLTKRARGGDAQDDADPHDGLVDVCVYGSCLLDVAGDLMAER